MPPPTSPPLSPVLAAVQRAVQRTQSLRSSPIKGYLAAFALVLLALALRLAIGDRIHGVPFIFFFPMIILSTFVGGLGSGVAAVLSAAAVAWYFLIPPTFTLDIANTDKISVAVFIVIGCVVAVLVGWLTQFVVRIADFEEHEKQLLRELQHRVKNHVQIVSSLLQIQARRADPTTQAALNDAGRRLATISTVYGSLYRSGHEIDFKTHLEELCHVASRAAPHSQCDFKVDAEPVSWGMDLVMPLSLMACELIANAIQHGCTDHAGHIEVVLDRTGSEITLTVSDSGARLPPGFDVEKSKGLGLQLVRTLSRQIQGKVSAHKDTMTRFRVEFPESSTPPH